MGPNVIVDRQQMELLLPMTVRGQTSAHWSRRPRTFTESRIGMERTAFGREASNLVT